VNEPATPEERAGVAVAIEAWAQRELADNPVVEAVDRVPGPDGPRWVIRVRGEDKDVFAIWLALRQRTLHFETYLMPAPEENEAALYEHLLRRNLGLHGISFCIGLEDAIFLHGEVPWVQVDDDTLDWILGALYEATERCFRPALRIGFASRMA
jgi:hypothetical protein